ncbi:MAG: helix-turn-helix transcriptional regulator [Ktedonobacteraceae bacterium]|nr:helix-turn-helix transcriptional regulator [Ktedonobacteraceae bacterium]
MDTKKLIASQTNILDRTCPSRLALDLVMDKWTPLVVFLLQQGPRRYTHLKRQIGGITQKMLTQTLRKLEREGLVRRTVYPTSPPTVEYTLTSLGETFCEPLERLFHWSRIYGVQLSSIRENTLKKHVESNFQEE